MALSTSLRKSKRLVIANWKLYIESPEEAKRLAQGLKRKAKSFAGVEVWLAPAAPLISTVAAALRGSKLRTGAQTLSQAEGPQHTGEVSALAVRAAGAHFCLVGHSERRAHSTSSGQAAAGESNQDIRAQMERAAAAGLVPVLCVGERERTQDGAHFSVLEEQVRSALALPRPGSLGKLVVAYEPVWAIGKGVQDAMRPAELEETALFIRKTLADVAGRTQALRVPILYGGSVEGGNAEGLLGAGISGFLVGHASAQEKSFLEILKVCKK